MSVVLKMGDVISCMDDDEYWWKSEDPKTEALLNSILDEDGPSGGDPHPAGTAAEEAAERFGGEVVRSDPPPRVSGRMY